MYVRKKEIIIRTQRSVTLLLLTYKKYERRPYPNGVRYVNNALSQNTLHALSVKPNKTNHKNPQN